MSLPSFLVPSPSQVVATGTKITRATLDTNATLTRMAIEELGTRVSVDTCAFHVAALYDWMKITVPGLLLPTISCIEV